MTTFSSWYPIYEPEGQWLLAHTYGDTATYVIEEGDQYLSASSKFSEIPTRFLEATTVGTLAAQTSNFLSASSKFSDVPTRFLNAFVISNSIPFSSSFIKSCVSGVYGAELLINAFMLGTYEYTEVTSFMNAYGSADGRNGFLSATTKSTPANLYYGNLLFKINADNTPVIGGISSFLDAFSNGVDTSSSYLDALCYNYVPNSYLSAYCYTRRYISY